MLRGWDGEGPGVGKGGAGWERMGCDGSGLDGMERDARYDER